MYRFENIIQQIAFLPEDSLNKLKAIAEIAEFPKNHLLIKSDRVEKYTYFIIKGLVRAFHYQDGNDITFWFGKENDAILSMKSYVDNTSGYENIELLEKSLLYKLSNNDLKELYSHDIHIANWGRKLAEKELLRTEENFISKQFKTATERYMELMKNHSELLQRIQLGHIASYLGITQVSLSRIRSAFH